MANFFKRCIHERKLFINAGIKSYTKEQLN